MESSILGALFASSVVAAATLWSLRGLRRAPRLRFESHRGRLRLPVRTFERAIVIALAAACGAITPVLDASADTLTGVIVVVVAAAWIARRGAFLSPGLDDGEAR